MLTDSDDDLVSLLCLTLQTLGWGMSTQTAF